MKTRQRLNIKINIEIAIVIHLQFMEKNVVQSSTPPEPLEASSNLPIYSISIPNTHAKELIKSALSRYLII